MSNGHTPGPWRWMAGGLGPKDDDGYTMKGPVDWGVWESKGFYDNPELFGGDGESVIVSGGGGEYCPIRGETPEERAANAHLIAAAPAMLIALQQAQQTCKELHDWLSSGEDFDYDVLAEFAASTEQQARAAIALAMGGATK